MNFILGFLKEFYMEFIKGILYLDFKRMKFPKKFSNWKKWKKFPIFFPIGKYGRNSNEVYAKESVL